MSTTQPDDHGRTATSPWAMPARGWKQVLKRTWAESSDDNIGLVAAGVAFYGFLAMVPLLGSVVLTYGLVADASDVSADLQAMLSIMPVDAVQLIGDLLTTVVHSSESKKGLGLLIALAIALYGGMNGASGIITALNIAYEEHDERGFFRVNLLALGMTAATVVLVILALLAGASFGHVRALLPEASPELVAVGRIVALLLVTAAGAGGAATLYRYGPDRRRARWIWLTPGSVAAALLWLLISFGFGLYVKNFGDYNVTYGSLGAVIVLMTWMYLSAYVLLLGAELNSELEQQTICDTTEGPAKPLGQRGAAVADSVAAG